MSALQAVDYNNNVNFCNVWIISSETILSDQSGKDILPQWGDYFSEMTLGILLKAKHAGKLAALRPVIEHLEKLGFRFHRDTRNVVLTLAGE